MKFINEDSGYTTHSLNDEPKFWIPFDAVSTLYCEKIKYYYYAIIKPFFVHFDNINSIEKYFNEAPKKTYLLGTYWIPQGMVLARMVKRQDLNSLKTKYEERISEIKNKKLGQYLKEYVEKIMDLPDLTFIIR